MSRVGPRARALVPVGVVAAFGLTACGTASVPTSEIGCPVGLSGAVAERAVQGGTPTARVQVVPPSRMTVPVSGPLRNACVLRISYIFEPSTGVAYQAITPGDAATVQTISAAMLRSGWVAGGGGEGRMLGPGGRVARIALYSSPQFLAALPTGFRMPPSSSYAHRSVAVLVIVDPHER